MGQSRDLCLLNDRQGKLSPLILLSRIVPKSAHLVVICIAAIPDSYFYFTIRFDGQDGAWPFPSTRRRLNFVPRAVYRDRSLGSIPACTVAGLGSSRIYSLLGQSNTLANAPVMVSAGGGQPDWPSAETRSDTSHRRSEQSVRYANGVPECRMMSPVTDVGLRKPDEKPISIRAR